MAKRKMDKPLMQKKKNTNTQNPAVICAFFKP